MDKIEKFFKRKLIDSENTKRSYRRSIELFFEITNLNINTYVENAPEYDKDDKKKIKKYNNYHEEHIGKYWDHLKKNHTQMTRKNRINAFRLFLASCDKDTRDLEIWDTIRYKLRNTHSETEETPLDQADLKKILQYGDIGSKAMFLIMASCGCRIGEVVQLLPDDIHTEETPTRIRFRAEITKTNTARDSFITPEATEAYNAWMEVRQEYLTNKNKKNITKALKKRLNNNNVKVVNNINDKRVFPMTDVNVRRKWNTIVRKAGYSDRDKKTNRLKAHPHSLRKFFRSYLGNADLAEHCMGHVGYLSTYRQYNTKQLAIEYKKYMHNISILESYDLTEHNDRITQLEKENADLKRKYEELDHLLRKKLYNKMLKENK